MRTIHAMATDYFGTDGIRGRVGDAFVNPEFSIRLGWVLGRILVDAVKGHRGHVILSKDTRISGYMLETALQSGLISAGMDVLLTGPLPTPATAWLVRTLGAVAGVVVSASHNPHHDNGFKFFGGDGRKFSVALEQRLCTSLDNDSTSMQAVGSSRLGRPRRQADAGGRYVEYCKSVVQGMRLDGMRIALDCAHGATYKVAPATLSELGAELTLIGVEPDGININHRCGSTEPAELRRVVLERKLDLGIAFDGDGDRVLFVDSEGRMVDGDQLLYILAMEMLRRHGRCDGVVGTQMSNLGLERALKSERVPFVRAQVGDRYVRAAMDEHGWVLGGESSGHIMCHAHTTTGDGIVAALCVLQTLINTGSSLQELISGMQRLPQVVNNVRVMSGGGADICSAATVRKAVNAATKALGDAGRILLRPSGTEAVVRVMVEGEDSKLVRSLAQEVTTAVQGAAGEV